MRVVEQPAEATSWVSAARRAGQRVAFVPTLGDLHAGHLSLLELARQRADRVVLSIFVNPLQFGPAEDFERYPRDLDRDLGLAREASVDLVFAPTVAAMYPDGDPWVYVVPVRGEDVLCGKGRPGHFRGVLTVVAKLFGIVRPDLAVFGRKDYQQLVLIRRMVHDLNLGVEILDAPTVREPDGLALSSRNRYLSAEERVRARALSRALRDCAALYAAGERNAEPLRARLWEVAAEGVAVEYGEVVDPHTLAPLETLQDGAVCAIAGRVGATRLIDNMRLTESL